MRPDNGSCGSTSETFDGFLITSVIGHWAKDRPDHRALIFLEKGEEETSVLSYTELHTRAQIVALQLRELGLVGERALLLFHPGIDYVLTFLGCLYAGVVAVPVYPPRNNWHSERAAAIARDADARAVLTSTRLVNDIEARFKQVGSSDLKIVATDDFPSEGGRWINPETVSSQVAYLQYTSGSTGNPKGVMVRHADLIRNCALYSAAAGLRQGDVLVSWLPIFHDMGLVQGIVMPLYLGGTSIFMPPAAFIQQPVRWLKAISRYQAVFSGAPNFAFDLCVAKVTTEEAQSLDLSSWQVAINGAEPISHRTFLEFVGKFAAYGFRPEAFTGAYGMAETTLYVTCGAPGMMNTILHVEKAALEKDRIHVRPEGATDSTALVSSGVVRADPDVRIVTPGTGSECLAGQVGEIWVSGSSVCAGYWNRPQDTAESFGMKVDTQPNRNYLRTGDLGFIHEGELYVTGRLKDLIIVRGANHYPQDLEKTAEMVDPALRRGGAGAAFSLERENGGEARVILIQEVERTARSKLDASAVGRKIAQAITEAHGIDLDLVVLVKPGNVPKTSSGKTQRRACRELFCGGKLDEIGRWERPVATSTRVEVSLPAASLSRQRDLENWLSRLVASLMGMKPEEVAIDRPFSAHGLSSVKAVELVAEIGQTLGRTIPPTIAFEYPTISQLAEYLAGSAVSTSAAQSVGYEPIAVIGMDCRFPGAEGVESFWKLLESGGSAVGQIPSTRRQLTGYDGNESDAFSWGGFLDGVDRFDASLFEISPREAAAIDPQQRLLLETSWRALESANIPPDSLAGSATGVFVGISGNDYFRLECGAVVEKDIHMGTGGALSIAANRISYCLGLQGPSLAIDTACSSSLVAIHQACRSLSAGESHLALAGGVNLVLSSDIGKIFTRAQMLSPTGRCQTFDEQADGYVRGEGAGVVVLKRLADALRDGNRVLAVIRGSAVNQDGYSNGLTAPNGLAQQRVVRSALQSAGFSGATIGYVETHGTGTPLGDPIEVRALRASLDEAAGAESSPCWLGAVKTNIGHLESAAGIAGLIKTVLVLQRGRIPANCNFKELNSRIDLNGSRLRVAAQAVDWPDLPTHPRRAGVSSFGFGGTNAHLVLEAFSTGATPATVSGDEVPAGERSFLLTLSARTEYSLKQLAADYARQLQGAPENAEALCQTANTGRARLPERLAVVGINPADVSALLLRHARGEKLSRANLSNGRVKQRPRIAFLFTGQGAQYLRMGQKLYAAEPVFKRRLDLCDEILAKYLGFSVREVIFGSDAEKLNDTQLAQPALVALELALAEQWRHWGVEPEFVAGHSIGEYAAACVAGVMDLETVLRVVVARGRLMASAPGKGAMVSVKAGLDVVEKALIDTWGATDLAAINAPDQIVLSGSESTVEAALETLNRGGFETTRLKVSHAFHSRLMDSTLEEFRAVLESAHFHEPRLKFIATGGTGADDVSKADYWVNQLRRPVRFADAMRSLAQLGANTFIEVGPAPVLIGLGQRTVTTGTWLPSLRSNSDDGVQMRAALGELFVQGAEVNFKRLSDHRKIPAALAPSYPFDRAPHWFQFSPGGAGTRESAGEGVAKIALLGRKIEIGLEDLICFEATLPSGSDAFLWDHRVCGRSIMPAAGYVSLMLEAVGQAKLSSAARTVVLSDLSFSRPLDLTGGQVRLQTLLRRANPAQGGWEARIVSWDTAQSEWVTHATATFGKSGQAEPRVPSSSKVEPLLPSDEVKQVYGWFIERGIEYGPRFQGITGLKREGELVRGEISLPAGTADLASGTLHPVILDSAFQTLGCLLLDRPQARGQVPLPVRVETLAVYRPCGGRVQVEGRIRTADGANRRIEADLVLRNEQGDVLAELTRFTAAWVDASGGLISSSKDTVAQMFYLPLWSQVEDGVKRTTTSRAPLCLYPPYAKSLSDEIVRHHGREACQTILLGATNRRIAENAWEIDVFDPSALGAVVGQLRTFDTVYFLGSIQPPDAAEETVVERSQEEGIVTLFRWLKALSVKREYRDGALEIKTVTNGAYAISPSEQPKPFGSTVVGLIKSAAREFSGWTFAQIDIGLFDAQPIGDTLPAVAEALIGEGADPRAAEVAIREGRRFKRTLYPVPLDAPTAPAFRDGGVYLILGGSGGIGIELARYLAGKVKAKLVLLGRSPLRQELQKSIAQIEAAGGEVLYLQADATDFLSLRRAVAQTKARFGALNGVIHSAVVLQDKAIDNMDETMLRTALASKVAGSMNLYRAVADEPLDFLLFFSSVQSFFGNAGQANYAGASTFQDAFAQSVGRRSAFPVKTINWGYWGEVGVAAAEHYRARLASQGVDAILPHEGMEAIERALKAPAAQWVAIKAETRVIEAMGADFSAPKTILPDTQAPFLPAMTVTLRSFDRLGLDRTKRLVESKEAETAFGRLLLLKYFQNGGALRKKDQVYSKTALGAQLGIGARHARWFDAAIDILARAGWVKVEGEQIEVSRVVEDPLLGAQLSHLDEVKAKTIQAFPELEARLHLLSRCVEGLPEILNESRSVNEILFPNGSAEQVENLYRDDPTAVYLNHLAADSVVAYVEHRVASLADGACVNVLEVGAGTGGTSAQIFARLERFGDRVRYLYSDVSPRCLRRGEEQFGSWSPFLKFRPLDIDSHPEVQGFEPGSFDLVLAANVLHTTSNIARSIEHVKWLLKRHGALVLLETTSLVEAAALTFGLREDSWDFEDPECRIEHAALLSTEMWERQLGIHGFTSMVALGNERQIMICQSDGIVSEPRRVSAPALPVVAAVESVPPRSLVPAGEIAALSEGEATQVILRGLGVILGEVLKFDVSRDFADEQRLADLQLSSLGIDSLMATELRNRVRAWVSVDVPAHMLIGGSRVGEVAELIHQKSLLAFLSRSQPEKTEDVASDSEVFVL